MFAAAKGHAEIVRFLISHEADINIFNKYDRPPDPTVCWLPKHLPIFSEGWSALMIAADWGHTSCVKVFNEHKHLFTNTIGWGIAVICALNSKEFLTSLSGQIRSCADWTYCSIYQEIS